MDLLLNIKNNNLRDLFINGNFGLEKEGLRTVRPADLATSLHPEAFGSREVNQHIKTDYGESMPEIITPPLAPYLKAHKFLEALSYVLVQNIPADEYIWPFSVPCRVPEDDQLIKISQTSDMELEEYRLYTTAKYGKKRQLVNGVHINYSFNNEFLEQLFLRQTEFLTKDALRDELYLKLSSNFLRYQWLLVYLFGATPVAEDNFFEGPFFKDKEIPTEPMRSLRNSQYGFTNDPKVVVRFDTLDHYVMDLREAVLTGKLRKEREYYGDVRLRALVKSTDSLLDSGIQYIEIRSFDNNPFELTGLSKETLQFVHLFLLTMLCLPEKVVAEETEIGDTLTKLVASEHPFEHTSLREEGNWLLSQMQDVVLALGLSHSYLELVEEASSALKNPLETLSGRIYSAINEGIPLLSLGEELGSNHKERVLATNLLPGFEHLTIDEQAQIEQYIQLGFDVPVHLMGDTHLVD